jgi:hypothetical protein
MIDHPHEPPMMLCKKTRTGPKMSISGWKMLAKTMIRLMMRWGSAPRFPVRRAV